MKKTYLARRNALLSRESFSWGAAALLFATLLLLVRLAAPDFFLQMATPLFNMSDALTERSGAFLSHFSDAASLAAANEKLQEDNAALAVENQTLVQKVATTNALLGTRAEQKTISRLLAGVVARPPVSPYDTLVLAIGSEGGVAEGMEAFGASGVPLGVVTSVLTDFSRVTLFSSPGAVTDGWVGHTNLPLTLLGAGGGAFEASVARTAGIAVGDTVYVPGPGALPLGSVVKIDSDPLSPGVILRIRPQSNPFGVTWVTLRDTGIVPPVFATSTLP